MPRATPASSSAVRPPATGREGSFVGEASAEGCIDCGLLGSVGVGEGRVSVTSGGRRLVASVGLGPVVDGRGESSGVSEGRAGGSCEPGSSSCGGVSPSGMSSGTPGVGWTVVVVTSVAVALGAEVTVTNSVSTTVDVTVTTPSTVVRRSTVVVVVRALPSSPVSAFIACVADAPFSPAASLAPPAVG